MRSVLPGVAWPAIVEPSTAQLFALAWQLEQTQKAYPDVEFVELGIEGPKLEPEY